MYVQIKNKAFQNVGFPLLIDDKNVPSKKYCI